MAQLSNATNRVKKYLDEFAAKDSVFNGKYTQSNKTLDGCMAYIRTQAMKAAINGMAFIDDADVFGWAVHYFDEDSIKEEKTKAAAPKANVATFSGTADDIKDKVHQKKAKPKRTPAAKPATTSAPTISTQSSNDNTLPSDEGQFDLFENFFDF